MRFTGLMLLYLIFFLPQFSVAADVPSPQPFLGIEVGMHIAPVRRMSVDATCSLMATGSRDKTVRLWALPRDRGPVRLLRTLRVPIDENDGGKIFAVALSPDGRWVAAGGFDAQFSSKKYHQIYIFDAVTGQQSSRIGQLEEPIYHLTFSPNGRYLAATLKAGKGLRVWDTVNWGIIHEDASYNEADSYGAAFGPDGALYTTAYDGFLRRYNSDFSSVQKIELLGGKFPYSVSVSPTGEHVAVGFDHRPIVEVYRGKSLSYEFSPNADNINKGNLRSVAWSFDGSRLYAGGGGYKVRGKNALVIWDEAGRGQRNDVPLSVDTISQLLRCEQRLAVSAADPALGVVAATGEQLAWQTGVQPDMRNKLGPNFTVSPDGMQVRFGLGFGGLQPVLFDVANLTLKPSPTSARQQAEPKTTGLEITDWEDSGAPKLKGRQLTLEANETSRSLAIAPDRSTFVLGAEWHIRGYGMEGQVLWEKPSTNTVWGVNIAANGKIIVAAYADGTIRWHRVSDGQELLALFVHAKDRRFIVWTPSGYYFASPGASELIGWHINRNWDDMADFYSISRFRARFYRPDIVSQVLVYLDEAKAISNSIPPVEDQSPFASIKLPPVVRLLSPSDPSPFSASEMTIEYAIRSPSGLPVSRVFAQLDGRPIEGAEVKDVELNRDQEVVGKLLVKKLPTRDAVISIIAEADGLASEPAKVDLLWVEENQEPPLKPNLYALIIGVGKYEKEKLSLGSAPFFDANDISAQLSQQENLAFGRIERRILTDDLATQTNIKEGLQWLRDNVKDPEDTALMYFSGHGISIPGGASYLLPVEYDPARYIASGLDKSLIINALRDVNGKVVVFIDACHAADGLQLANLTRGFARRLDTIGLVNDFAAAENGIIAFASSSGNELSYVSGRNSYFSRALLEGLRGDFAPRGSRLITTDDLSIWLRKRVLGLSNRRQTPVMTMSPQARPVLIAIRPEID